MAKKSSAWLDTLAVLAGLGAAAAAAYAFVIRPWHLRWGSTDKEVLRPLPGDELVPNPKLVATHAVTIVAAPEDVWPWIAQLGQGRGGFYSYDWIENLMGLDIQTSDRILPEYQALKAGDQIPLAPAGDDEPAFSVPVAICEPGKVLVMHGDTRLDPDAIPSMRPGDHFAVTWALYLEPLGQHATRLVERWRADWNESPTNFVFMRLFLEPGAFLMERKMLLGIKERAERH